MAVSTIEVEKLRPVLKWVGSKYTEFSQFEKYIPAFEIYYEPFAGAAGVFFALQPKESYLNDIVKDLIDFYKILPSPTLKRYLYMYCKAWEAASLLAQHIHNLAGEDVDVFIRGRMSFTSFTTLLTKTIQDINTRSCPALFQTTIIKNVPLLKSLIIHSIGNKAKRRKRNASSYKVDISMLIETGVKSSLYQYFRTLLNIKVTSSSTVRKEHAAANWFFVRELCYGAMFRYNQKGLFNIPYGGYSYNKKNMWRKVHHMVSPNGIRIIKNARWFNVDYKTFLKEQHPKTRDFVFVDPPYDTRFSKYDQHPFTKDDHTRLRDTLLTLKTQWMLVIKETSFIRALYCWQDVIIKTTKKTYRYHLPGIHQKKVTHLISSSSS